MVEKEFLHIIKLLQMLIKKGKKDKALKFILLLLRNLKYSEITDYTPIKIINQAIINIKPLIHIQKIRKSSKIFYLPKIITTEKKTSISLQWIIKSVNTRKEKKVYDRLTNELLDCLNNKGLTVLKKQNLYETIITNRPFLNLLRFK